MTGCAVTFAAYGARVTTSREVLLAHAAHLASSGQARRLREAAGVSVGAVAAASGTNGLTVLRWESGEEAPTGAAGADWARVVEGLRERASRHPHWT